MPVLENKIIDSILTDDLENVRRLLNSQPTCLKLIPDLLPKVYGKEIPLRELAPSKPEIISTSISYTCSIGCEMCGAGFSDKTSLYKDYKYLSPGEFDALTPWLQYASRVQISGLGETLDSPHIYKFLNQLRDKNTYLQTSGVSLTKEKINSVIKKWNRDGLTVSIFEKESFSTEGASCHFVSKYLIFLAEYDRPSICCGSIIMPLKTTGLSPERYWNSFPHRYFRYLHSTGEREKLPYACQTCWVMSPGKYSEVKKTGFSEQWDGNNRLSAYHSASSLKDRGLSKEAEKIFMQVVRESDDSDLKGKAYFHLGEMRIREGNLKEALSFMELAVRHCFHHRFAFAYLYLLYMAQSKRVKEEN